MAPQYEKDSYAVLDYKFDWASKTNGNTSPGVTDWLETGETITAYSASVVAITSGCTPTIVDSYYASGSTAVVVWLSGGTKQKEFNLSCAITTSSSPVARRDERTMKIVVKDR